MVYQTVIGMLLRWPTEALRLLAYTDEQKDMLAEPTARLADRFAPRILQNNQELIIWGSIFAAVTQKNFMTASAEAKKKMQEKNNQRGAPGAGPVRIPGPAPADRPAPKIAVPFAAPYDDEGQSLG